MDMQGAGSSLAVPCLPKSSAVTSLNIHLPKVTCSVNQSLITLHHHLESRGRAEAGGNQHFDGDPLCCSAVCSPEQPLSLICALLPHLLCCMEGTFHFYSHTARGVFLGELGQIIENS